MSEDKLVIIHNNLQKLLKTKAAAMPKGFNETRFLQNAMAVLQDTKDIEKMETVSVARTMLKGAFLGLDFFNRECYAIPYANKLNFQTDYKGEIKLAKKYSLKKITDIYAKLVRVGDVFTEHITRGQQYVDFHPKPFNNAEIIGVFAVCLYKDDSMLYETMAIDEVEHVRDIYSKVPNGKAWKDSKGEMTKKTCLRRLCKFIELEFDSIEQAQAYKDSSDVEFLDEVEYEPIEMPIPKGRKLDPEASETMGNLGTVVATAPASGPPPKILEESIKLSEKDIEYLGKRAKESGRFIQWSEIGPDGIKETLNAIRELYKANKDQMLVHGFDNLGKLLAHFNVKSLSTVDMTPEQYWRISDFIARTK